MARCSHERPAGARFSPGVRRHLSDAVRHYYEMGFLAAAVARRLTHADHGDNALTDENGEPIKMTKR